ncbi:hypothetical protein ACFE04_029176 [Oxalis oulophora]
MESLTVEQFIVPYRILVGEEGEDNTTSSSSNSSLNPTPTDGVIFFGVSLLVGIASRHFLRGTRVPYTVALLILGIALGSLGAHIDPDLLLAVFLPALLFESSFSMEIHQIKRCMPQMLLLAAPGVVISTFLLGSLLKLAFPYNWDWKTSLLLGGLLSATDPVAVVALLKDLGASKKLTTIIEGESLMNDGTAIVVFQLFFQMVMGKGFTWAEVIKFLAQVSLGAVAIGVAFGVASVLWLGFIFNDTVIEIALTLAVSYITYFTAQEASDVSGVLAVMTLGMFYSAFAKTAFKGESQQSLHHFWEMIAYIANTLIFILSGVVIAEGVFSTHDVFGEHGYSWGYLFILYLLVQLSRGVVVAVLFPVLRYFGYGLDWKEAIILIWSGLRGAVALALSLSVKRSSGTSSLPSDTGTLFVFFTGGIVFLTLIVNGSTTQFALHLLDMDKLSATKTRILNYTKFEMLNKAIEAFSDLGDDEELGPTDWPTVKRYISSLNDLEPSENSNNLDPTNLKDIRIRFLNGIQAAYWGMLEEGRITQNSANILMRSVDAAIDLAAYEPLCDWKGLKDNVHLPNYYKFLQSSLIPRKLVMHFIVERLESACSICAAFLRAHRIARRQLNDFLGESDIASLVFNESNTQGEEARKFLEEVRLSFPHVLRVVKTRQVTYSVLNHLIEYVHNLEKSGLLEQREMVHLHDAVQTDLKRLLRNPPLVKIPKIGDLISLHPLLGALPPSMCELLQVSTKEIMKMHSTVLYKEGAKPSGIWLIFNGVVKWTSKSVKNKHSLHLTFTHSTTLGLYEVLTGKPYICDMITDSVVLCVFIESDKIHSVLKSDPELEDFFWKESAIILARILLPRIFEKMSMQKLRVLVAEHSTMTCYIRGETVEIPNHSIGILLDGFLRSRSFEGELITSPAALFHPQANLSFSGLELSVARITSCSHQGLLYLVDAPTRVIFFDIASFEADNNTLMRRPSSFIRHSGDLHTHHREHRGLMSWPENFFPPEQHKHNNPKNLNKSWHAEKNKRANSMSAKALQLSMFGSLDEKLQRPQSFTGYLRGDGSGSMFYPRVPSYPEGMRKRLEGNKSSALYSAHDTTDSKQVQELISDESGGEEELIVRIDSPSRLSFRLAL